MTFPWVIPGHYEIFQTISEDWGTQSGAASIQVKVPWNERHDYAKELLSGDQGGPKKYPFELKSGETPLLVSNVHIDPMPTTYEATEDQEDPWDQIEYAYALITITFTPIYTELSCESTLQFLTIYPDSLFWNLPEPLHLTPEEAPGFRLPTFDLVLTNHFMKPVCDGIFLTDFDGLCNKEPVIINYRGFKKVFQKETLLCTSPTVRTLPDFVGTDFCDCGLRLCYNPMTHNEWFHPLKKGSTDSVSSTPISQYATTIHTERSPQNERNRLKPIPTVDFVPILKMFGIS